VTINNLVNNANATVIKVISNAPAATNIPAIVIDAVNNPTSVSNNDIQSYSAGTYGNTTTQQENTGSLLPITKPVTPTDPNAHP
jgi:hypothetical protein